MPEGAVYVGRGTAWGNPYIIGHIIAGYGAWVALDSQCCPRAVVTRRLAVELFRAMVIAEGMVQRLQRGLRGRDLVCWCPPDQPCHADVLLELANR